MDGWIDRQIEIEIDIEIHRLHVLETQLRDLT